VRLPLGSVAFFCLWSIVHRKLFLSAALIAAASLTAAFPMVAARADSSGNPLDLTAVAQMVVDSAHGHLFFTTDSGTGTVVVTNLTGRTVGNLGPVGATAMALSPDGSTLYVGGTAANPADYTVNAYSTATLKLTAQYSLGNAGEPESLAVQSGMLWISIDNGMDGLIGSVDLSAATPAFQLQLGMDEWETAPILATDPAANGDILVAVQSSEAWTQVETYNTTGDPVNFQAQTNELIFSDKGTCADVFQVAVVPGGGQFIPACQVEMNSTASTPDALYLYGTTGLKEGGSSDQGSYAPVASPDAVAIAADTGLIAAGGSAGTSIFEPGGDAPVNVFSGAPIGGGVALSADGSELYVVTDSSSGLYLNVYDNPSVPRTPTPTPTPTVTPTPTPTPTVTPTRTPALTVGATPSAGTYRQTVRVTAHLGSTDTNRTVAIYAQTFGSDVKTRIASGRVNSAGDLTVSYPASHSTTFSAGFTGDAEYLPRTVTTSVTVAAEEKLSVGGYYGTSKQGSVRYLLFRVSAKLKATATVLPAKSGECVKVQSQYYYKDAWHAGVTSGCIVLNKSSAATGYLTLGKDHLGYPYRVRVDYIRGKDVSNLGANTGWQYFKVVS
jgi:hypothetical protein